MSKEKILEVLSKFPDEFVLDEFIEHLIFIEKVEKGLRQADSGKGIPHEEIKRRFN